MKTDGSLTQLNVGKFIRGSKLAGKGLTLVDLVLDGTFSTQINGPWVPQIKVTFIGNISQMVFGLNLNGKHSQKKISNTALELELSNTGVVLSRPLKVEMFGVAINYSGGFKFSESSAWSGAFDLSGSSLFAGYLPRLLQCRTKPRNSLNFSIEGSFDGPVCH